MKQRIRLTFLFLIVSSTFRFVQSISACTPGEYGTPLHAYFSRSDAVFIGKVISIERAANREDDGFRFIYFKVLDSFKGKQDSVFKLQTSDGSTCDTEYKTGQTWAVYANVGEDGNTSYQYLAYKFKRGKDKENLSFLNQASQGKLETIIIGWLENMNSSRSDKSGGFDVAIEGNGIKFLTKTDREGKFQSVSLNPGTYNVRIRLPFGALIDYLNYQGFNKSHENTSATIIEYQVILKAGECDYKYLQFKNLAE